MPIKYSDNAVTTLGANLGTGVTSMTLAGGGGALFNAVDNTADVTDGEYITFIRASDSAIEVARIDIHDGVSDSGITITRDIQGVHGGIGLALVIGDAVEGRIPQELLEGLVQTDPNPGSTPVEAVVIVPNATLSVNEDRGVTIGSRAENRGPEGSESVVIGYAAKGQDGDDIGELGHQIVIGAQSSSGGEESIVIGYQSFGGGDRTICIGGLGSRASGTGAGNHGITIGSISNIIAPDCIWIGNDGDAGAADGDRLIVIGHDHDLTSASVDDDAIIIGHGFTGKRITGGFTTFTQPFSLTPGDTDVKVMGNSTCEVVVATAEISFENGSPFNGSSDNFLTFTWDTNAVFYVEAIEVYTNLLTGAVTTGLIIDVGTSGQNSTDILAAGNTGTGISAFSRERVTFAPAGVDDGHLGSPGITVTIDTAGVSAGIWLGQIALRGIFVSR
jgi:hypothetical protein